MVNTVLMLVAPLYLIDGMKGYMVGPIRALGLQKYASYFALISYYIVGLPVGIFLGLYLDYGVLGLQTGGGSALLF